MQHKKKAYTIAIIAFLTLSMVLAAIPTASASPQLTISLSKIPATATHPSIELQTAGDGKAEWTTEKKHSGAYSVLLYSGTQGGDSTGRVVFPYGDTLSSIDSISFWINIKSATKQSIHPTYWPDGIGREGYWAPYVVLELDHNDDGAADDWLVLWEYGEASINTWVQRSLAQGFHYGAGVDMILGTADDVPNVAYWHSVFNSALITWLPEWDQSDIVGTLSQWQGTALGSVTVLNIKIACGEWAIPPPTEVYVDDITITYTGASTITIDLEASGNVGDTVTVIGSGATSFGLVEIYWENLGGAKLGEGYADSVGAYSIEIVIPEDVAGSHWVVAKDVATGAAAGAPFTIEPEIVLTPTSGLPGDSVAVAGTGFAATSTITITFDDTVVTPDPAPETSALGSFSTTFVVPTVAYGPYTVTATDAALNFDTAPFTVTATITLTPDKGPTGTVVTITGEGFTEIVDLDVTITVGAVTAPQVAPIKTEADGTFTGQFIVPTVSVQVHDIVASDGTITATKSFNVTEKTTIILDPTSGQPGWSVTIEGLYFTAIADTEVTVTFDGLTVKTLYTNATGGFLGTFNVPSLPTDPYIVNATDANDLTATANFTIAITLIVLDPTEGPTGTEVTITGYGFTDPGTANVTIDTTLVLEDILVSTLHAGTTFVVPTLPVGTYTVTATDSAGLTASTTFQITKTTELILTPSSAPVDYEVSIVGNYFSGLSTIEVVLYNATYQNSTLNVVTGSFTTFENGTFTATFLVPSLDLGDYFINATDPTTFPGALKLIRVLEVPFSVVEVYIEMYTRATEYLPSDTISFYIKSTFAYSVTITIEDPTGYPATVSIASGDWLPMGDFQVVPYEHAMFVLPSDAELGAWSWTATIGTEEEIGAFAVVEKPTLSMILDRLDELNATITSLVTDAEGNLALLIETEIGTVLASLDDINATISGLITDAKGEVLLKIDTALGTVTAKLNDLDAKIVSIQGSVVTIETMLGTVQTSLSDLDAKLVSLDVDVATISTAIGDVKTSVDSIGLTVESISGDTATIKTDLGTINGKVTSIDGNVATIKTDVGTVKAEFPVTVDMTPVWIAVVLSLIAAIAACYAVITIRRKIAG